MRVSIYTLTIRWRHGDVAITPFGSESAYLTGLREAAYECHDGEIPADTPESVLITLITRRDHEVNTDRTEIDVPDAPALPAAIYDRRRKRLTCPHCGYSANVRRWILVETGCQRFWDLEYTRGSGGVINAHNDRYGDDGDGYVVSHTGQTPGAARCDKDSALPQTRTATVNDAQRKGIEWLTTRNSQRPTES